MGFGIYGVRRHEEALYRALTIRSPDWVAAAKALKNFDEVNRLRLSRDRNKSFFARLQNAFLVGPQSLVTALAKVPVENDVYAGNNKVWDAKKIRAGWLAERKKQPKKEAKIPPKKSKRAAGVSKKSATPQSRTKRESDRRWRRMIALHEQRQTPQQ